MTATYPFPHSAFIGFDALFERLERASENTGYPPHNIIKIDDDNYTIEIAVAGFGESELDIQLKDSILTISGDKAESDTKVVYLHKGISSRKFVRQFTLNEYVEVKGAELSDGVLKIELQRVIPEDKKPRKIAIAKKQFIRD